MTGQLLRLATVSAMTECVIVRITKADTTRVIHEEPAFAELFISHLLARNSRVEEDLVDQLNLTIAPYMFGGADAPTLTGLSKDFFPRSVRCSLTEMRTVGEECFLTYGIKHRR